ncbi:hypothetical protein MCAP1_000239 [Malassezia caprae]|uniref:Vacuolar sorting protein Vps3844 C-terminal domain-containing protein n=1 Tax=Malassezia caprae TaxID=1381934 RepID=A0AAF0E232_9BASI|nr:hypothetical protein MCAP1_000239 [Malassezia caprae]
MPSLVYAVAALAAPVMALARTTLFLNSPAGDVRGPVAIHSSDAHKVLAHHLGIDVPALPRTAADSPGMWHHLPHDCAKYSLKDLFEPQAPRSGVLVTFHGLDDEHGTSTPLTRIDLFPASLVPTHEVSSHQAPSDEALDHLASLYEEAATGTQRVLAAPPPTANALERLAHELTSIEQLVQGARTDLEAFARARISALADVQREFGAHSKTFQDAKAQVKQVLTSLVHRAEQLAGARVALVHTSEAKNSSLHRRTQSPLPLQTAPERMREWAAFSAMDQGPKTCYTQREQLEAATNTCSLRGTPIQTTKGGKLCWRCKCKPVREGGRTRFFAGAACEKDDYSSQTLLIIGTVAALYVATVGSIALLYREGQKELPGTLASVSLSSS